MKQLIKLCEKDSTKKLLKLEETKKQINEMNTLFAQCSLNLPMKTEADFFFAQLVNRSLLSKQAFETVFYKAYYDMADYWQTLNYTEKKRLVNIEIEQLKANLPYVTRGGQRAYIPIFDERMNHIYSEEMVLFELKQYERLRFDFKTLIQETCLHSDEVAAGFTSLTLISEQENGFVCWCEQNQTCYVYQNNQEKFSLPLPLCQNTDALKAFSVLLFNEDEDGALRMIIEQGWLSEKYCRKGEKLLVKRQK